MYTARYRRAPADAGGIIGLIFGLLSTVSGNGEVSFEMITVSISAFAIGIVLLIMIFIVNTISNI